MKRNSNVTNNKWIDFMIVMNYKTPIRKISLDLTKYQSPFYCYKSLSLGEISDKKLAILIKAIKNLKHLRSFSLEFQW